jgi:hypothetical protein
MKRVGERNLGLRRRLSQVIERSIGDPRFIEEERKRDRDFKARREDDEQWIRRKMKEAMRI